MLFTAHNIIILKSCLFTAEGNTPQDDPLQALDTYYTQTANTVSGSGGNLESISGAIISAYWSVGPTDLTQNVAAALSSSLNLAHLFAGLASRPIAIALEFAAVHRWESAAAHVKVHLGASVTECEAYVRDPALRIPNGVALGPQLRKICEDAGFNKMQSVSMKFAPISDSTYSIVTN